MTKNLYQINHESDIPKYRQLVNNINVAIAQNQLHYGDMLPSVNQLCDEAHLSRDTVFKSYQLLKSQGIIDSVPNKGYYVAKEIRRVFLLLDTFKAYKEVLYHALTSSLPDNYIVDVQFHHYNLEIFQKLVEDSAEQYANYVIMPFDHSAVKKALKQIPKDNLLIIDWNVFNDGNRSVIAQDFGASFAQSLAQALPDLQKYKSIHLLYPKYTNHPAIIKKYFSEFCETNNFSNKIITSTNSFEIQKKTVYITVSERSLGYLLRQCKTNDLKIGSEVGIISYNETPMKEFIGKGISVISTDFELMGQKIAEFILGENKIQQSIPTKFIKRQSI